MKKSFLLCLLAFMSLQGDFFDDIGRGFEDLGKGIKKGAEKVGKGIVKVGKDVGKGVEGVVSDIDKGFTKIGESFKKNKKYVHYIPPKAIGNKFNVLAYNVYLRPRTLFKNGQFIRVRPEMIPKAIGRHYDAIIFSEVFDNPVRSDLIKNMKAVGYKYATPVVGKDGKDLTNGGVMIMSKHKIVKSQEGRFGSTCGGTDCQADKGWMYAKIKKGGKYYHVVGTHTQAWPEAKNAKIRNKQFDMITRFIQSKKIPKNQPVIIGGDLNVDKIKYPTQHAQMLKKLRAKQPRIISKRGKFAGNRYTYDGKINDLADRKAPREYLDYVLYSKDHAKPVKSYNMAVPMQAPKLWKEYAHESYNNALSDHFPVHAYFEFPA